MVTKSNNNNLGININDSTIEIYTPAKLQEIFSFVNYLLSKYCKTLSKRTKKKVISKRNQKRSVCHPEIF